MNPPINCPECGGKMKHIPAGTSKKTGKPYGEFWACSNCEYTWNPPKSQSDTVDKKVENTQEKININELLRTFTIIRQNQVALAKKIDKLIEISEKDDQKKAETPEKDDFEPEKFDNDTPFVDY